MIMQYYNQMSQTLQLLINIIGELNDSYELQSITDLEVAIQTLDELMQDQSNSVAKKMDQFLDIFDVSLGQHPNVPLLTISHLFGFIADIYSVFPKLGKNNKNRCVRMLRNSLKTITKISNQIDEAWYNPPNGYSEQNQSSQDYVAERQIMRNIDSLATSIGRTLVSANFEPLFKQFLGVSSDWRYPYAALMIASQLSGSGIKLEKLHIYIENAINFLQNPSPMIRYACFHLIGQFSDQMKPHFQQKYYDLIVPQMIKHLQDPVPRVVTHDLACFTNFFEDINDVWNIQNCLGQIFPPILHYLKTANSMLKENSISVLSSLATTLDAFGPNLTQILEIANEIITTCVSVPQLTQLTNQAFQLISLILRFQRKSEVEQYVKNYVSLLFNQRHHISGTYFLNAWGRICSHYESFIELNTVFDILMEVTQKILQEEGDEQAEQALSSLNFTCQCFKVQLLPYAEKLITLSKSIFEDKDKLKSLRERAVSIIVKVVVESHCQTPQIFEVWQNLSKNSIQYILQSIDSIEQNYEELYFLYDALSELVKKSIGIFNQAQFCQLADQLRSYATKTEQLYSQFLTKKQQMEAQAQGNQVEQNQLQVKFCEQDLNELSYALQYLPEVYSALITVNDPSKKQWLIIFMMQQISKYTDKTEEWKLFGISLSATIIQKSSFQQISNIWTNLLNLYISNSSHAHTRIRNIAIYGIGLIIQGIPIQLITQQNVIAWLQSLWSAFTAPYEQDKDEDLVKHCNENIVSTLGKLLHKCSSKFPVLLNQQIYQHWASKLPLNEDKPEGDIQQKFLIQLLSKNPGMIVTNAQDLKKICVIYASFISKRHYYNHSIMNETKESLKAIANWPLFKQSENYLWSNLKSSQLNLLTKFMAN